MVNAKVFMISDTHFGHTNIIKYCNRPFKTVEQMDYEMCKRWNQVIRKQDIVYFLGDLTIKDRDIQKWLHKLNGHITFIAGNHDNTRLLKCLDNKIVTYEGVSFYLTHDPETVPIEWKGWVIHGHKHNNDLVHYPFINYNNKTINVSVEVINYKPIDFKYLVKLIK